MIKRILTRLEQFAFFDTFKHSSTYFLGTILAQGLGLISLPFFTSYLTPDEYGLISIFTSYVSIVTAVLPLSLHVTIGRYYFEKDKKDFDEFLGSIIFFTAIFYMINASLIYYYRVPLALKLNVPSELISFSLLAGAFTVVYMIFEQIKVSEKSSKEMTKINVLNQYIKFGCAAIGVLYFTDVFFFNDAGERMSYTFAGKIIGEVIGLGLVVLFISTRLYSYFTLKKISLKHLKYAISYSLPLVPLSLSHYILVSFDQWYINMKVGQTEAGEYSFAYKIGFLYVGLVLAVLNGSRPSFFKLMNEGKYSEVADQIVSVSKLLMLGACFLMLYAVDLGTLLSASDSFLNAISITPIIVGGYIFSGLATLYSRGIEFKKKTIYLSCIIIASGAVNVVLNMYLIEPFGYKVAAYTTLASYFIMMVLSVLVTTFILKLPPLPLAKITKHILFLAGIIAINYIFGAPNVGLHIGWIAFKGVLFLALVLLLFYDKIYLFLAKNK